MKLIIWAEWLRFRRSRSNVVVLIAYCAILTLCALWAAHGAQQYRQASAQEEAMRAVLIEQARADAQVGAPIGAQGGAPVGAQAGAPASPRKAALHAFTLGRSMAGLAQLSPEPGLALSLSQYNTLNTRVAVSVESRYADGRRSDAISNPALAQYGAFDLAAVVMLLMPLVALAWSAGAVQEDRERGIWRTVRAQAARPALAIQAALAIRALALVLPAALACGLATTLDAGSTAWPGMLWWTLCLTVYAGFWIGLCGLLAALPISSSAALMTGLTTWLLLTYAVPTALESAAAARHPMPSRLTTIVQMRQIQQDAETRMPELLSGWYGRHPGMSPLVSDGHTWPVTFLPRFESQDERLRPLMQRFDRQRLAQAEFLDRWIWLSPPMTLLRIADHLAGIGTARHVAFNANVDRYEAAWRDFFVPRIMSYRGLSADDYSHIPRFRPLY